MKTIYQLEKSETDELFYFKSVGSIAYKFHYLEICFTIPFFLLLTYECFEHLHTSLGKLVLTFLSMLWLIKGSDWFWKSKIHCFAENKPAFDSISKQNITFEFDEQANSLHINNKEIQQISEAHCLQSCMFLTSNQQSILIPWRIFENDEVKGQFIRACIKIKSKKMSYSHKEA